MYHKPSDPITFLEECLAKARNSKDGTYDWDTFHKGVGREDDSLSLTSAGISEVNDKADPSPTEDSPKTENDSGDEEEKKLKIVKGKPILFVLVEYDNNYYYY